MRNESFVSAPQLKRDPLGSMTHDIEEIDFAALRRWRLVIRAAVVAVWVLGRGSRNQFRVGSSPWWHSDRPWPYPLGPVVVEIARSHSFLGPLRHPAPDA